MYTWAKNVWDVWFLARNHDNHQYFDPSLLLTQETLTDFHGDEAIFFEKKIKIADSKKLSFSKPPILNIFFPKISCISP